MPRRVGRAKAKELIFTARPIDAATALAIGLANQVVAPGALLEEAKACAAAIAVNGPVAVRAAETAINRGMEMDLASALVFESTCYDTLILTEDRLGGLAAFREKRKPAYRGR